MWRCDRVLIDVSDEELRRRIRSDSAQRHGAQSWRLAQLERYSNARPSLRRQADLVIDTTSIDVEQVADTILADLRQLDLATAGSG